MQEGVPGRGPSHSADRPSAAAQSAAVCGGRTRLLPAGAQGTTEGQVGAAVAQAGLFTRALLKNLGARMPTAIRTAAPANTAKSMLPPKPFLIVEAVAAAVGQWRHQEPAASRGQANRRPPGPVFHRADAKGHTEVVALF